MMCTCGCREDADKIKACPLEGYLESPKGGIDQVRALGEAWNKRVRFPGKGHFLSNHLNALYI